MLYIYDLLPSRLHTHFIAFSPVSRAMNHEVTRFEDQSLPGCGFALR